MTERLHDRPARPAVSGTDLPPSAAWFERQGDHFLGAQALIQRIGAFPEDYRSYREALAEDDESEQARCNMALDAIKLARSGVRFARYGIDSDLYVQSVKKFAVAKLGERASLAFQRAGVE